ncbi:MAG TPA: enolase C-terminal domain-like protein [bacterium]|nr:enolase C-terminal domain-like protein [bacterium]
MKIKKVNLNFEIEPLKTALGFKGGYLSSLWQTAVCLESAGNDAIGLGTQSILWSDASVFSSHSEAGGNILMSAVTEYAANLLKEMEIENPITAQEEILEEVHSYASNITGKKDLRKTFTLNALVALDNALWILFAKENNLRDFYTMIPEKYRKPLAYRHPSVACIPLVSYGVPLEDIGKSIDEGFFTLKIKIGSDPDKDGDRDKMLEWDKARIKSIHERFSGVRTKYTDNGKLPYYFDANGRYDSRERLWKLVDFIDKIGALEQVAIIEEPFPEDLKFDVRDFPVKIIADESAHTEKDTAERASLGYRGVALKPIAKTLSMTLKILNEAEKNGMEYFCADLTVIPPLLEWNKNIACRLKPYKGFRIPILESNGHQNYRNWEDLLARHPMAGSEWISPRKGIFMLGEDFYRTSGGIYETPGHYGKLVTS